MILIRMMILTLYTFLITKNDLEKINETLGPDNYDNLKMDLKLVPQSEVSKSSTEFYLVDTTNFEQSSNYCKYFMGWTIWCWR